MGDFEDLNGAGHRRARALGPLPSVSWPPPPGCGPSGSSYLSFCSLQEDFQAGLSAGGLKQPLSLSLFSDGSQSWEVKFWLFVSVSALDQRMGVEWGKGVATEGQQEGILGVMETICILILGDCRMRGTELIEQHREKSKFYYMQIFS